MGASRTGTTHWLKLAAQAKHLAQVQGQTQCPWCDTRLNYHRGLLPNSAEPDHIIPHAQGGRDTLDNLRIICRRCNQSKGDKAKPKRATILRHKPLRTSRVW